MQTLDQLAVQEKINQVDILKIDVEGAEKRVLDGATQLLERGAIKQILLELNPRCREYGYTKADTLQVLENAGYSFYIPQIDGLMQQTSSTLAESAETCNIIAKK